MHAITQLLNVTTAWQCVQPQISGNLRGKSVTNLVPNGYIIYVLTLLLLKIQALKV